ncbi:uncharacterized protein LOC129706757 isoform X1 [Leucoraja erinacea]|uniref:uncharacterized protein LOC129706757 isoform X1 n=1 Tax=Leucoraja erinaceus TaxID=7782 RepID=UPI002458D327|nr:uncharacterized protein LOC129706757 isoform X1 [Leucoraja erinacea]
MEGNGQTRASGQRSYGQKGQVDKRVMVKHEQVEQGQASSWSNAAGWTASPVKRSRWTRERGSDMEHWARVKLETSWFGGLKLHECIIMGCRRVSHGDLGLANAWRNFVPRRKRFELQ